MAVPCSTATNNNKTNTNTNTTTTTTNNNNKHQMHTPAHTFENSSIETPARTQCFAILPPLLGQRLN